MSRRRQQNLIITANWQGVEHMSALSTRAAIVRPSDRLRVFGDFDLDGRRAMIMRHLALSVLLLGTCISSPAAQQSSAKAAAAGPSTVKASFYSNKFNGRVTASKQRFDNNALTAAHRELPLGTRVKLTNPANNRSVVVRINDRGPFVTGRDISVTRRAARALGFTRGGLAELSMEVLGAGR